MLGKFLKVTLLSCLLVSFGTLVKAQDSEVKDIKVGAEYRAALTYNDHKVEKTSDNDPNSTTDIALEYARVHLSATLPKEIKAKVTYDALNNILKAACVSWTYANMFDLSFGKMRVKEGGYHLRGELYNLVTPSIPYEAIMPFNLFTDMIQAKLMMSPVEFTIQFFNDQNSSDKRLTSVFELLADLEVVKPIIQFGLYNKNKSSYFVLGLAADVAGLGLELDYINDTQKDSTTDTKDVVTSINFKAKYALQGFTPWLEINKYDVKQDGVDLKANPASETDFEKVSDNSISYSIGATCDVFGKHYVPYVALINQSGSFYKEAILLSDKETRNNMMLKFGVYGKF